jgi:hypothetical protein
MQSHAGMQQQDSFRDWANLPAVAVQVRTSQDLEHVHACGSVHMVCIGWNLTLDCSTAAMHTPI